MQVADSERGIIGRRGWYSRLDEGLGRGEGRGVEFDREKE